MSEEKWVVMGFTDVQAKLLWHVLNIPMKRLRTIVDGYAYNKVTTALIDAAHQDTWRIVDAAIRGNRLNPFEFDPITIDGHPVTFTKDGSICIGCTFVDSAIVERILQERGRLLEDNKGKGARDA